MAPEPIGYEFNYYEDSNYIRLLRSKHAPFSMKELHEALVNPAGCHRRELLDLPEAVEINIEVGDVDWDEAEAFEESFFEIILEDGLPTYYKSEWPFRKLKTFTEFYFMYVEYLEKFWKQELETLLREAKKALPLSIVAEEMGKSFLNYYHLKPYLPFAKDYVKCDAGIRFHETKFDEFLLRNSDLFYLKTDSFYTNPEDKLVGLTKWNDVTSEAIKELSLHLPGILRAADDHTLSFDDLHHRVNRLPIKLGIPKPFSVDFILRSLKVVPKRFEIDEELKTVTLTRDTRFLHDYFMENKVRIDQFNPEYEGPAIIAFIFEGDYIFEEDEREYFKLRPIIYIGHYENLKKAWKSFIDEVYETRLFIIRRFFKLNANTDIEKLGKENLRVAEYYEKNSELSPVVNEFINRYAPAYVTEDNPGNFIGQKLLQEASMEPLASFDENRKKYLELDPQDESQKEQFIEFIKSDIKKCGDKYYFDNFMHCIELYDTLYDSVEAAVADYWERLETNDGAIPPEELAELFRRFSEAKNNEEPATTEDTNMTDPSDEAHRTEVIYQELIESYKHDKIIELLEDCYEKLSVELPFQFTIENLFSVLQNSPEKVVNLIEGILRINYQTKKSYWKAEFLRTLNFIMVEVTKDRDKSEYGTDIKKE